MKILITYPPLNSDKGTPLLSQNRQFQYFKEPTFIYPVIPATAATMLKKHGFDVLWNDAIFLGWNRKRFFDYIEKERPDIIAIETKTPVVKQHWRIINQIKDLRDCLVVLFGDHVTALPVESFENSKVDFVLTGGDYDFLLLNLCKYLSAKKTGEVVALEPGIYYRQQNEVKNTGKFTLNHNLDSAPFIDRDLTSWQSYSEKNGNFKRIPGTYIMSGRDCWWGKCKFCSWTTLYPQYRVRSVDNVIDEIGDLIENYGVKEIMDDAGTFPVSGWLRDFCTKFINRGFNKKIYLDCNMRFGALTKDDFALMKKANFRLLLFGLESANQETLEKLDKNLKIESIIEDCKNATQAGLFPHITIMFGYPWESYEKTQETLKLGAWLLKKGYAYTMQATLMIPYPGTPLFEECKKDNLLTSLNWDDYDMKKPIMKVPFENEKVLNLIQEMYRVSYSPQFLMKKIFSIRDLDDLRYFSRAAKKIFGHIFDFSSVKHSIKEK